jgi:hypothetical protein
MQLLGLRCASEKSPKNARVPPLLLQPVIAMASVFLQAISTILQLMISKFPSISLSPPPLTPLSLSSAFTPHHLPKVGVVQGCRKSVKDEPNFCY